MVHFDPTPPNAMQKDNYNITLPRYVPYLNMVSPDGHYTSHHITTVIRPDYVAIPASEPGLEMGDVPKTISRTAACRSSTHHCQHRTSCKRGTVSWGNKTQAHTETVYGVATS